MENHDTNHRPVPCVLAETCVPCEICPSVMDKAEDRLALTPCSVCGQEWYEGVERECIKRGKCGFRVSADGWIKATDINHPGGWYWTRLGDDDESCPQVVFVALDNNGDAAPDFRVLCMGESSRTSKLLKQWHDQGWEFMEIPLPPACQRQPAPTKTDAANNTSATALLTLAQKLAAWDKKWPKWSDQNGASEREMNALCEEAYAILQDIQNETSAGADAGSASPITSQPQ